jgi:septum formation protein
LETIILASGSPRRREILTKIRIPFKAVPPGVDEAEMLRQSGPEVAAVIAGRKVETVAGLFKQDSPKWILGADTVVEIDHRLLGKPAGSEEAYDFLRLLSGRVHRVHTGLALLPERHRPMVSAMCTTEVKFRRLSPEELEFYHQSGEWSGAAGAYRIQEQGGLFVEWVKGSYTNVVGLPLETLYVMLKEQGYLFEK